jgi:hypothetical protein
MKIKNKMQIVTNIICGGMGYALTQDSLIFLKVTMGAFFILWILTQSMYSDDK